MAFAARFALLCAVACTSVGAAPVSPALAPLLARMRAVNGPLYTAHIVSTSRHIIDGAPAVLTTDVQDVRYLQEQCTGTVCVGTYFDGERLFSVNINGTALPYSRAPEARVRALRILAMQAFLDPHFSGLIYDGGTVKFHGINARRIYVSDAVALPLKIYVDPKSALVVGAQDISGAHTYELRDYRRVGRFMLPYAVLLNGTPLETYMTRDVVNEALDAPSGIRVSKIAGAAPSWALDANSVTPMGTCRLRSLVLSCLIDSGNSAMALSVEAAEQLDLHPVGMLRVAGLGDYATEVVRAGPLRIANVQVDDAKYMVLSDIHRYGYDLVIGADLLAALPVTIDYRKREVYFDDTYDRSGATLPLTFENFLPVVGVRLGSAASQLAVDTGDQSTINLAYDYYRRHPDLFRATATKTVSGVGGESEELIGQIGSVSVGSITAQNQQIGATKTLHGTADGHLGAGFLSRYRVVFDYAHQLMRLLPSM